ncbi:molybdopterin-guanine dinucleotide biosynthesis protein A [Lewinella aquimaris]|uniref:Probable molybdenum cofactor guanylyltransferase n=1 Tax=Neolewinella aquimaris TaxID=1835722 RepID=A0A840E6C0_9BACT|nr:NTP transferase domain-containing protein [Neolewinella aquimaris]MBB4079165.1 molybdopterin-guanine dinucleotide biosynthesis protein A [Neolewinella aquimaris]
MHQKHPKIARPALGNYARTEFALVGSTCERMEKLMRAWADSLSRDFRCLLVTGEHHEPDVPTSVRYDRKHFTAPDASWNDFDDRLLGQAYDLALVNGNHYPAARQIVFVDENKAGTLERRRDQLSDVFAVVHVSGELPEWLPAAPVYPLERVGELLPLIADELRAAVPRLRALILAGGRSERMGEDKSKLVYRDGNTEVERLAKVCADLGVAASVSVREAEDGDRFPIPVVTDRFLGLGPAGAICSAFLIDPDAAWLVLACDLPLLEAPTLRQLISARRPDHVATAVRGPGREWPEPLVAIYEPRAYPRLLQFLALGYSCPRKLLINSNTAIVDLEDLEPLTNANTPEERRRVQELLG